MSEEHNRDVDPVPFEDCGNGTVQLANDEPLSESKSEEAEAAQGSTKKMEMVLVLISAVIGAGASMLTSELTSSRERQAEEIRWERQNQIRFHEERLELYVLFLKQASDLQEIYGRRLNFFASESRDIMAYRESLLRQEVASLEGSFDISQEKLNLVSGQDVRTRAEDLSHALREMDMSTINYTESAANNYVLGTERLWQLRQEFIQSARTELGIDLNEP